MSVRIGRVWAFQFVTVLRVTNLPDKPSTSSTGLISGAGGCRRGRLSAAEYLRQWDNTNSSHARKLMHHLRCKWRRKTKGVSLPEVCQNKSARVIGRNQLTEKKWDMTEQFILQIEIGKSLQVHRKRHFTQRSAILKSHWTNSKPDWPTNWHYDWMAL